MLNKETKLWGFTTFFPPSLTELKLLLSRHSTHMASFYMDPLYNDFSKLLYSNKLSM